MITLDVFNNDAFAVTTMIEPVNLMPTEPGFLGSLGLFQQKGVSTTTVGIQKKNGRLDLIETTPRGAPIKMAEPRLKDVRNFSIPRLAKGDKLFAAELQNVIPDPGETDVDLAVRIVAEKQQQLKQDLEYTKEYHRLGALQGVLLDADSTTIYDFYDEWDIASPTPIDLAFSTLANGALRTALVNQISRPLIRASQAGVAIRRVIGLAGDDFYDALVANGEVRVSYLNWQAAAELRGNAGEGAAFATFKYGGIEWINYQGSDDNDTIAIDPDEAIVFPVGVPGMFRHIMGPGESFGQVNRIGQDVYPLIVRDTDRDMWVQPEIYSYPLFVNTRPDLVLHLTHS
jgi:hypothetical protein